MRVTLTTLALVVVVLWGLANSGQYLALVHG